MSRAPREYSQRSEWSAPAGYGLDVEVPREGFYRMKLRSDGIYGVVKIAYGPPMDPDTGEEMDRSWRWQAFHNGTLIDWDRAWPACARMPCTEADYRNAIRRQEWAKKHAPDSAYADPKRRNDPLSSAAPLPF